MHCGVISRNAVQIVHAVNSTRIAINAKKEWNETSEIIAKNRNQRMITNDCKQSELNDKLKWLWTKTYWQHQLCSLKCHQITDCMGYSCGLPQYKVKMSNLHSLMLDTDNPLVHEEDIPVLTITFSGRTWVSFSFHCTYCSQTRTAIQQNRKTYLSGYHSPRRC